MIRETSLLPKLQCRYLILATTLSFLLHISIPANEFVWSPVDGILDHGVGTRYEQQGIPSPTARMGVRIETGVCVDPDQCLWFFGGESTFNGPGDNFFNDLWLWEPSSDNWTWIKGDSLINRPGRYGLKGVAAPTNNPGSRKNANLVWGSDDCLWLFGGEGYDVAGNVGFMNDLWRFDPISRQWTWISGSALTSTSGNAGIYQYGSNVALPSNRSFLGCANVAGEFWFYGSTFRYSDVWRFTTDSSQWAWMHGRPNDFRFDRTRTGLLGEPSPDYFPGSREAPALAFDNEQNIWLFGGRGYPASGDQGLFNQLWGFDINTLEWTRFQGRLEVDAQTTFSDPGTADESATPGARLRSVMAFDPQERLWLYGGHGIKPEGSYGSLNELWSYDLTIRQWAWYKGDNSENPLGVYGMRGIPSESNIPPSDNVKIGWIDSEGSFWIFQHDPQYKNSNRYRYENFWRFTGEDNNWTWMGGREYVTEQYGSYGLLGQPDPSNIPGAREAMVSWTTPDGDLWLFGGVGSSSRYTSYLGDLWRFSPETSQWTWIHGSDLYLTRPHYGIIGQPDVENIPGARINAESWTGPDGNLWMFGGWGPTEESYTYFGLLNDLWRYDPISGLWTWVNGSSLRYASGIYGTQGIPSDSTIPGARESAMECSDTEGGFWLFGGHGYGEDSPLGRLNDLWNYNTVSNLWTWVSGSKIRNQSGHYGTRGQSSPDNAPGGRHGGMIWIDKHRVMWLFGGYGLDHAGNLSVLNDLWKFDLAIGQWTWIHGSADVNQSGIYGTRNIMDQRNTPGARHYSYTFTDDAGNLWLFGGSGFDAQGNWGLLSDLWRFDPIQETWTWVSGTKTIDSPGIIDQSQIKDTPLPGARYNGVSWSTEDNQFWLFGGKGNDASNYQLRLGDLWHGRLDGSNAYHWKDYD